MPSRISMAHLPYFTDLINKILAGINHDSDPFC